MYMKTKILTIINHFITNSFINNGKHFYNAHRNAQQLLAWQVLSSNPKQDICIVANNKNYVDYIYSFLSSLSVKNIYKFINASCLVHLLGQADMHA